MTILDHLRAPIVLAPLGGGPSTPELAAPVTESGGLGVLAAGYLTASEVASRLGAARRLSAGPPGVNVFASSSGPADPAAYSAYVERFRTWSQSHGIEVGEPRYDDDDWAAKIELLETRPVEVVSFAFGCPAAEVIKRLRSAGSEVWVTVTSPAEADEAEQAGADVLVVQGAEAGAIGGRSSTAPIFPCTGCWHCLT